MANSPGADAHHTGAHHAGHNLAVGVCGYQSHVSFDTYSVTCFTDRKLSSPHRPSSRPMPERFRPPQGACTPLQFMSEVRYTTSRSRDSWNGADRLNTHHKLNVSILSA